MRFFRILLPWLAAGALGAAEQPPDATLVSKHPAAATELVEGPLDSAIAKLTSQILEVSHYSRQPFDAEMGGKFLDRYLSALDFQRLYFLQSDLDEFDQFRPRLHDLTKRGKTYPARIIFTRFLERLEQPLRIIYIKIRIRNRYVKCT